MSLNRKYTIGSPLSSTLHRSLNFLSASGYCTSDLYLISVTQIYLVTFNTLRLEVEMGCRSPPPSSFINSLLTENLGISKIWTTLFRNVSTRLSSKRQVLAIYESSAIAIDIFQGHPTIRPKNGNLLVSQSELSFPSSLARTYGQTFIDFLSTGNQRI